MRRRIGPFHFRLFSRRLLRLFLIVCYPQQLLLPGKPAPTCARRAQAAAASSICRNDPYLFRHRTPSSGPAGRRSQLRDEHRRPFPLQCFFFSSFALMASPYCLSPPPNTCISVPRWLWGHLALIIALVIIVRLRISVIGSLYLGG